MKLLGRLERTIRGGSCSGLIIGFEGIGTLVGLCSGWFGLVSCSRIGHNYLRLALGWLVVQES